VFPGELLSLFRLQYLAAALLLGLLAALVRRRRIALVALALASAGVAVRSHAGPSIGSDHFPLLVEAASGS